MQEREEQHRQRRKEADQKAREELARQRQDEAQLAQWKRQKLAEEEQLAREKAKEKVHEMIKCIQHVQAVEESRKQMVATWVMVDRTQEPDLGKAGRAEKTEGRANEEEACRLRS